MLMCIYIGLITCRGDGYVPILLSILDQSILEKFATKGGGKHLFLARQQLTILLLYRFQLRNEQIFSYNFLRGDVPRLQLCQRFLCYRASKSMIPSTKKQVAKLLQGNFELTQTWFIIQFQITVFHHFLVLQYCSLAEVQNHQVFINGI